jgi:hypothetical protein
MINLLLFTPGIDRLIDIYSFPGCEALPNGRTPALQGRELHNPKPEKS